ncbi:MAG TPA: hypothetical protein DCY13_17955 [Verrucomicrobiales bacterium]|nr:hypothetical protein [Verrucomicrobiales bacterium]
MRSPLLISAFVGVVLLTAAPLTSPAAAGPSGDYWKDPGFVAEFIGSFGIRTGVEPSLSADEQLFYRELAGIIATNQPAAIRRLNEVLAAGTATVQPPAPPEPEDDRKRKKPELPDPIQVNIQNKSSFWFVLGNLQVLEGMPEAALDSYRKAIGGYPDFLRAHQNLGVLYVQNQKFEEALPPLLKALELGGNDGDLYGLLGACYLSTGQNRSAELAYNQAMVLSPGKKDWQLGAARALIYQGRYREAGALFAELIRNEPGAAQYWKFQANCHIGLNEPLKAAYCYEVVRQLGEADAATLFALGDIYLSRGLKDVALDVYLAALNADPGQNRGRTIRAAEVLAARRALDQAGGLIGAIRDQAGAVLDEEEKTRLLRLDSKIALARGEDAGAARIMEDLLGRDPMDGEIMLLLAGYYGRSGEVERAEAMYGRVSRLPEYEAEANVKLAQLLVRLKLYERAVAHLRRALELEPKETVQRYLEGVLKAQAATRS